MEQATMKHGTMPNVEIPASPMLPNHAVRGSVQPNATASRSQSTGDSNQQNMDSQKSMPQTQLVHKEVQSSQLGDSHQNSCPNVASSAHGMNTATLQSANGASGMSGVQLSKQNVQPTSNSCSVEFGHMQIDDKGERAISGSESLSASSGLPSDDASFGLRGKDKNPEQFEQRELPRKIMDWSETDYASFAEICNRTTSLKEIKMKLNNVRTEKVAQLVLMTNGKGYPIDSSKIAEWFTGRSASRSRLPLVKVCGAPGEEYIRISRAIVERFGFNLEKGQEYEVTVDIEAGCQVIKLSFIQ